MIMMDEWKNQASISSDYAIVATTAKAVSFMEFHPPLSYNKKNALDSFFYFDSEKIYLAFTRPFWSEPNALPIIPFNSSTQQNGASAISDDLARVVRKINVFLIKKTNWFYPCSQLNVDV